MRCNQNHAVRQWLAIAQGKKTCRSHLLFTIFVKHTSQWHRKNGSQFNKPSIKPSVSITLSFIAPHLATLKCFGRATCSPAVAKPRERTKQPSSWRNHEQSEWWSQTGSNRRPHACKARALPTELWPQSIPQNGKQHAKNGGPRRT